MAKTLEQLADGTYRIDNIANLAADLRPADYNKKVLYEIVKKACDSKGLVDPLDLAAMYAAFTPKHPAKPKTMEQWCWKAVAKKDVRHYLNFAYSDGRRLMATDGHRLHIWKTKKYTPGFYDSNMNMAHGTDFAKYPDVDRVIPLRTKVAKVAMPHELEVRHQQVNGKPVPVYVLDDLVMINKELVDQALSGFDEPIIRFDDATTAIKIEDGEIGKTAVVMPMRW